MIEYANRSTAKWRAGETRDIHRDMMRLTLEIVVRCLFSADVSSDVDEVGATLKELVKPFASQATLRWILNNRLPTPYHFRLHSLAKKIDQVVYRIIAERRRNGRDEGFYAWGDEIPKGLRVPCLEERKYLEERRDERSLGVP